MKKIDKTISRSTRLYSLLSYIMAAVLTRDISEYATLDEMWPVIKKDLKKLPKLIWLSKRKEVKKKKKKKPRFGFSGLFYKGKPIYLDPRLQTDMIEIWFIDQVPEKINMDIVLAMRDMANAIEEK